MSSDKGKKFEKIIFDGFNALPTVSIDRIPDQTTKTERMYQTLSCLESLLSIMSSVKQFMGTGSPLKISLSLTSYSKSPA